jgi:CTP synthase
MAEQFEKMGISFVGKDSTGQRMEIMDLKSHPWFGMAPVETELNTG